MKDPYTLIGILTGLAIVLTMFVSVYLMIHIHWLVGVITVAVIGAALIVNVGY